MSLARTAMHLEHPTVSYAQLAQCVHFLAHRSLYHVLWVSNLMMTEYSCQTFIIYLMFPLLCIILYCYICFQSGHYCPSGTAMAVPCPVGTLGQITRAQSDAACVSCPTGLYCGLPGSSQPQGRLSFMAI